MTTVFSGGPVVTGTGEILENATVLVEKNQRIDIYAGSRKTHPKGY